MSTPSFVRLAPAVALFASVVFTGCFSEAPSSSENAAVNAEFSNDARYAFLVEEMKVEPAAISRRIDTLTSDTIYEISPVLSARDIKMGVKTGGIGFTQTTLDRMMAKAKELNLAERLPTQALENAKGLETATDSRSLAKKAHTRWDVWSTLFDIKLLTEVYQIKLFIPVTGADRLGPHWQSAIRTAIANWNAQAAGTAVSFVETLDSLSADIVIRGSFGLGNTGTMTHMAFPTPDQYVEPGAYPNAADALSLWVNTGFESNTYVPMNQKATCVMSLLFLGLNITFVGGEGFYYNLGDFVHIPGTPVTDGSPTTPGSSVLTYGTSDYSTPNLSAGDIRTLRIVYPFHGDAAIKASNTDIRSVSYESTASYYANGDAIQGSGDTLFFLNSSGALFMRIRREPFVTLWNPTPLGPLSEFIYKNGKIIVRTKSGILYAKRTITDSWLPFASSVDSNAFRFDGDRAAYVERVGSQKRLSTKVITPGSAPTAIVQWQGPDYYFQDLAISGDLVALVERGYVWVKKDNTGWYMIHNMYSGYAYSVKMGSNNVITFYLNSPSLGAMTVAVRTGGMYGSNWYSQDLLLRSDYIHVCGDKVAYLDYRGYLRTLDYSSGTQQRHEYESVFSTPLKHVRLLGDNCDYINGLDYDGNLWTKWGISPNTNFNLVLGGVGKLQQSF